uniref:C-type lectin domain-containing protein n=1 Tax=Sander lucioperca TaxID=283035 RepID=A0A8C9YTA6_SANLU
TTRREYFPSGFSSLLSGQCSSIGGQLYDYHFIGENMTWKEAQDYCRNHHTDLATVSNQTDMHRLHNPAKFQAGAWIGLQRDWRWSQPGVEFNESKWSQGEPNNLNNQENCVWMRNDIWNDESCSKPLKFICYDEHNASGETFYISNSVMTWPEAQSYCRRQYTDLISGVKQLEDFKRQHQDYATCPNNNNPCPDPVWIGLFRDSDWSWSDGNSFSFRSWDNKNMTWVDALYYCRDHYRDLVSITNQDEQLWVQERAKMASTPYVWLGLRYTCTLDLWFWVTDEMVCYNNWGPGQSGDNCNTAGAMDREGTWVKKTTTTSLISSVPSKNQQNETKYIYSSTVLQQ